jgi:hypothetical protein
MLCTEQHRNVLLHFVIKAMVIEKKKGEGGGGEYNTFLKQDINCLNKIS